MTDDQITGRIEILERLNNSRNGNPRYAITLSKTDEYGTYEGTWNTAADHAFNYEIGNRGFRVGDAVTITIGGRGTIVAMAQEWCETCETIGHIAADHGDES